MRDSAIIGVYQEFPALAEAASAAAQAEMGLPQAEYCARGTAAPPTWGRAESQPPRKKYPRGEVWSFRGGSVGGA